MYDRIMKLLYVPFAFLVGTVSASVATRIWRRTWRALAHEEKVPRALDHDRSWLEIFIASAIRGMIFGVVRAMFRRAGAAAFSNVTATWPGRQSAKQTPRLAARRSR
jgi:hypothetical protein